MDDESLADVVARLERSAVHLVSLYLFGSHAEDRAHRDSDIDLGVLLDIARYPTREARFEARLRLIGALASPGTPEPDVVVLNDAPPTLGARVVTRGRRLLCHDAALDHAFRRDVQLRAADLQPFLRRMRAIKLQALQR